MVDPLAEPPRAPADDDFALTVEVRSDPELPVAFAVEAPPALPLEGLVPATVVVSATQDVYVGQGSTAPGLLTVGEGRLIAVAGPADTFTDPAHPELGLQAIATALPPSGLFRAGRRPRFALTLVTQAPPFAPALGTYEQPIEVRWWHHREPPEPYPYEPDGVGTVVLAWTLEALSDAAAESRDGQVAAEQALALPECGVDELQLAVGEGPVLSLTVDAAGWFGQRSDGARRLGGTAVLGAATHKSASWERCCSWTGARSVSASTRRSTSMPRSSRAARSARSRRWSKATSRPPWSTWSKTAVARGRRWPSASSCATPGRSPGRWCWGATSSRSRPTTPNLPPSRSPRTARWS